MSMKSDNIGLTAFRLFYNALLDGGLLPEGVVDQFSDLARDRQVSFGNDLNSCRCFVVCLEPVYPDGVGETLPVFATSYFDLLLKYLKGSSFPLLYEHFISFSEACFAGDDLCVVVLRVRPKEAVSYFRGIHGLPFDETEYVLEVIDARQD